MACLIDTNIFVAALRGKVPHLADRFLAHSPQDIFVPYLVVAELRVGAAKSGRREHHDRQITALWQPFVIAWPDLATVQHYVDIRSTLEATGTPIGESDLWIAATARASGGILVTHNQNEFRRVEGLRWEDWIGA